MTDTITQITEEILKITNKVKETSLLSMSGDDISWTINRLAVLRVNLGQELSQATAQYDIAYVGRKIQYASQYNKFKSEVEEKLTQKDLDTATIVAIGDMMTKEIELKQVADSLKLLYDSSGTLIMTLQSRLNVMKQERLETSKQ